MNLEPFVENGGVVLGNEYSDERYINVWANQNAVMRRSIYTRLRPWLRQFVSLNQAIKLAREVLTILL